MESLLQVLRERFSKTSLDLEKISKILLKAVEEGRYKLEDEEYVLFFEGEKLLLPKTFYQSQSWDDRKLTLDSEFVMPETIKHLIVRAEKEREWNPEFAVEEYLEEIEEKNKDLFLKFFEEMKNEIGDYSEGKKNSISGNLIMKIAEEVGIDKEKADRIRGEFKKGGIISPCSNRIKDGCLSFEINPSLLEKQQNKNSNKTNQ